MVMLVLPGIDPVATLDVAVIVMGFVVGTLTIVPSPGAEEVNVTSPVLAVQVTELVRSCVVTPPE